MKKFNLFFAAMIIANVLFSQTISSFENLTLAADTFWDGSDLSAGFASGNAYFVNDYNTSFFSWSGFVYSDKKDSVTSGYGNQYAAITASGYNGTSNYAIADEYGNAKILLTGNAAGKPVYGFYVTNTTYAYLSMKNGDAFAKKFGGANGTDEDWFRLRVLAWKSGVLKAQTVDFYLADFRSADSTQDYIVRDWTWVNLLPLGDIDSLLFQLSSSDTGTFGMNTPAYFALDNFTTSDQINSPPVANNDLVSTNYLHDTLINVLANDFDTTLLPLNVEIISGPLIPGASATVTGNSIHYTPSVGIVATDTLVYRVCDAMATCAPAEVIINVTGITGVNDLSAGGLQFDVYPNPFSNELTAKADKRLVGKQLTFFDVSGKLISNQTVFGTSFQLQTTNLASGIYFVKLTTDEEVLLRQIVKE